MHVSARQWNAINVINLLEISGANKLSVFDVYHRAPILYESYIFTTKTRVILFSMIASIKLALSSFLWAKLQFLGPKSMATGHPRIFLNCVGGHMVAKYCNEPTYFS